MRFLGLAIRNLMQLFGFSISLCVCVWQHSIVPDIAEGIYSENYMVSLAFGI